MEKKITDTAATELSFCYEQMIVMDASRVQTDSDTSTASDTSLNATQLFSFFTADIIKQEALFTR